MNARLVYDLYRRHADQVGSVVEAGVAEHSRLIARQQVPSRSLLRQVIAPADVPTPSPPPPLEAKTPVTQNTFHSTGDCWEVGLAGTEIKSLLPSRGAAYIHALLSRPGEAVTALELVRLVQRHAAGYMLPSGGEMANSEAIAAYRSQADDLQAEIDAARRAGDADEMNRLRQQVLDLETEIERQTGLGGRARKAPSPAEAARKSVQAAIRRTREKIQLYAPDLDRHLDQYLSTGLSPIYSPPAGTSWQL